MNTVISPIEFQFATSNKADVYDVWFRAKVEKSLQLADQPDAVRIPHDEVMSKVKTRISAAMKEQAACRLA